MHVIAVSISSKKGEKKVNQPQAELKANVGIVNDIHADCSHRQLSLLALESIQKMRDQGLDVNPGDFAENITTAGLSLHTLPVGSIIMIGSEIELELTQIGKECHSGCSIARQSGKCVMPTQGVFCRILHGGIVRPGDPIQLKI